MVAEPKITAAIAGHRCRGWAGNVALPGFGESIGIIQQIRDLVPHRTGKLVHKSVSMAFEQTPLVRGTLDLLILKSLALEEMHGLGIARRVERITAKTFRIKPGSLFPSLYRMEQKGWVVSTWGESEKHRRAKYYRLTKPGRGQLKLATERWDRISLAIDQALDSS